MPWSVGDVDSHKKGLTDSEKEKWVKIANGILDKCLKDGGSDKSCAPRAIQIANSEVGGRTNMEMERRNIQTELQIENIPDHVPVIRGMAAVFNSVSENLGGFTEKIMPGAFVKAIGDDVRALINHDSSLVLGRTKSGTLKISETERGLEFECNLPDTSYARDLKSSMDRGDIDQCSFGFSVPEGGDSWQKDASGQWERTINTVSRLYDVTIATYPAYPETSCALRSLEKIRAETIPPFDDTEIRKLRLEIEAAAL